MDGPGDKTNTYISSEVALGKNLDTSSLEHFFFKGSFCFSLTHKLAWTFPERKWLGIDFECQNFGECIKIMTPWTGMGSHLDVISRLHIIEGHVTFQFRIWVSGCIYSTDTWDPI